MRRIYLIFGLLLFLNKSIGQNFLNTPCITTKDCDYTRGIFCDDSKTCSCKPNSPYFDTKRMVCVSICPVGSRLNNQTKECVFLSFNKLKRSTQYSCKKCNGENQYVDQETKECKEKIEPGEPCSAITDQCASSTYCLKENLNDNNSYCQSCKGDQFPDPITQTCKDYIEDDEPCSSFEDKCKSKDFNCIKNDVNDKFPTCKFCGFGMNLYYDASFTNTMCKKAIKDGAVCSPTNDVCKSSQHSCLKKKTSDKTHRCINCACGQYVDLTTRTCMTYIKNNKKCPSSSSICASNYFHCIKIKKTNKNSFCRKCDLEVKFIDNDRICRDRIKDGEACDPNIDFCLSPGSSCIKN